jgi:hypothetical protein
VLHHLRRESREEDAGDTTHRRLPHLSLSRAVRQDGQAEETDGRHLGRAQQREAVREQTDLVRDDVAEHEVVNGLVDRGRGRKDGERKDSPLDDACMAEPVDHGR